MPTLTIRNIEETLKKRLRVQAAMHGHSMEEEARGILRAALVKAQSRRKEMSLAEAIRKPLEPLGFIDLPNIKYGPVREPPDFSGPEYGDYDNS